MNTCTPNAHSLTYRKIVPQFWQKEFLRRDFFHIRCSCGYSHTPNACISGNPPFDAKTMRELYMINVEKKR